MAEPNESNSSTPTLTQAGKYLIIITAFLGWFFGGMHMAITSGAMRSAAKSLHIQIGGGNATPEENNVADERLKKFDANQDGVLAAAELPLAFFDANTNSVLDAGEIVLANFNINTVGVLVDENALLKKFDANQDNELGKDENSTAHLDADGNKIPDKDDFALQWLDTNGNGSIDASEASRVRWRVQSDILLDIKLKSGRVGYRDGQVSRQELVAQAVDNRLNQDAKKWAGYYVVAFLLGAALGGLVFGRLGDRYGRVKGMAASIFCYSGMSALAYFVQTPEQLWVARFLVCMGVGGMWPNGVALMSEAWAGVSRPMLAGVIGTSANVGIFLTFWVFGEKDVTVEEWRWVMLLGASPVLLGLLVLVAVPESPRWLAEVQGHETDEVASDDAVKDKSTSGVSTWEVFEPPLLWVTLVGILLATVPLLGGWGCMNWANYWAGEVGERINDPGLKADVGMARSMTGLIGSFLGGLIASRMGRRQTYFVISVIALGSAQYLARNLVPGQDGFLLWFSVIGFFSGIYFGWLPLFLPELFTTRVRSTGSGVCFNFGRLLTAGTVLTTTVMLDYFNSDYGAIIRVTSFIYLLGAIGILLMPKGVEGEIKD